MNKTVIITGASRGIGKAIAKKFYQNSYNIALVSKNITNLEKAKTDLKSAFTDINSQIELFTCDLKNIAEIKNTVNKVANIFDTIDILINSAGISYLTPSIEQNYEKWMEQIQVNLTGAYIFSNETFLKMKDNSNSNKRIINISSIYGLIGGEGYSAYCASKHGLNGLTKSLALEYASYGITVNSICPAWVKTDMFEHDMEEIANYYNIEKELLIEDEINAVPSKKFTTVEEISDLCFFLASNSASNITGQNINISGGLDI
ncbi:MAG: SDR family oxidoreductase [Candidatus Sericytochromatia bacterium]